MIIISNHYNSKINNDHKILIESYGFIYKNEYSYGNHLRNAIKKFPELYNNLLNNYSIENESNFISYYFNYLNEQKDIKENKNKIDLNERKKKERELLAKYNINPDSSFYHYVIAAHRHGFNTSNDMKDVENYFIHINEKQKLIDENKILTIAENDNFAVSLGFKNYKQALRKARNSGFKSENERNDIKNYINFEIGSKTQRRNRIKRKDRVS